MDTNKMREQFESVAREVLDWSDDEFRLASDGKSYYWGATGEAWVFWQASHEAVVVEIEQIRSEAKRQEDGLKEMLRRQNKQICALRGKP